MSFSTFFLFTGAFIAAVVLVESSEKNRSIRHLGRSQRRQQPTSPPRIEDYDASWQPTVQAAAQYIVDKGLPVSMTSAQEMGHMLEKMQTTKKYASQFVYYEDLLAYISSHLEDNELKAKFDSLVADCALAKSAAEYYKTHGDLKNCGAARVIFFKKVKELQGKGHWTVPSVYDYLPKIRDMLADNETELKAVIQAAIDSEKEKDKLEEQQQKQKSDAKSPSGGNAKRRSDTGGKRRSTRRAKDQH